VLGEQGEPWGRTSPMPEDAPVMITTFPAIVSRWVESKKNGESEYSKEVHTHFTPLCFLGSAPERTTLAV